MGKWATPPALGPPPTRSKRSGLTAISGQPTMATPLLPSAPARFGHLIPMLYKRLIFQVILGAMVLGAAPQSGSEPSPPAPSPVAPRDLSDVELADRVARLDRAITEQWTSAGVAHQREQEALVNLGSLRRRRAEVAARLAALRRRAGEQAVQLYISAGDDPISQLLLDGDPNQSLKRRALSDTVAAADRNVEDQLRAADEDLATLEAAVAAAEKEHRDAGVVAAGARGELDQLTREQVEVSAALAARIESITSESSGHDGAEAAILEVIRERATGARSAGATALIWPAEGPVTSEFGARWGRMHRGVDIGADEGTPVRAARAGTVIEADYLSGYGLHVLIDHGDGLTTLYAHLSVIHVTAGEQIAQGSQLGEVGMTGNTTGPHLHFETRKVGDPQDPRTLLPPGRALAAE